MVSGRPQSTDEEAIPAAQCQIEPLGRLRDLFPALIGRPARVASPSLTTTSTERRRASSVGTSLDQDEKLPERISEQQESGISLAETTAEGKTVLYLAYGSNLSSKTFLGVRGIKPLSQIAVLVPELRLTFDLPGIPYAEPCFAGTQFRHSCPTSDKSFMSESDMIIIEDHESMSEKAALLSGTVETPRSDYTGREWHKPLVGVVYEVTLADYAKIIATEGGGRGYRDIVVDCHPFSETYKSTDPVPDHPFTPPFKAHTLLSPSADTSRKRAQGIQTSHAGTGFTLLGNVGMNMCRKPGYAQPSARYLNLIATGAEEHDLPMSYRAYLAHIQPYKITTVRQKIGKFAFLVTWGPGVLLLLTLSKTCAGPDGRSPPWLVAFANLFMGALWSSYDFVFKPIFGDGERTLNDTQLF